MEGQFPELGFFFGATGFAGGHPVGIPWSPDRVGAECTGRHWSFFARRQLSAPSVREGEASVDLRRTAKMARLEAVLLVADGALGGRRLAQLATLADGGEARELVDRLNAAYDAVGSAFRIERVASGYQLLTRPEFAFWLDRLHQRQSELKLSSPAMETLSIVAYRQPITRADIEAIRGVQCSEMLKQLMERGLVRIGGEDDSLGRPYLYETTRKFLELFGLRGLEDLPMADRLRRTNLPIEPADSPSESDEEAQLEPEVKLHQAPDDAASPEAADAA